MYGLANFQLYFCSYLCLMWEVSFEAFTTECNEVFLSNELCENDIEIQHFKEHFCPLMKDEQKVSETQITSPFSHGNCKVTAM